MWTLDKPCSKGPWLIRRRRGQVFGGRGRQKSALFGQSGAPRSSARRNVCEAIHRGGKSKAFDKRSYAFPHSQLAKRTREKLWALGIGMAEQEEQEESGTSKASSVDGDRMFTHAKGALQMAEGRRKAAAREARAIAELARKQAAEASATIPPATPPTATPAATQAMASLPESGPQLSMRDALARKQSKESPQSNAVTNTQHTQRKSPRFSGIRGAGGERSTFFRTRALTAREQSARAKSPIREKLHADGQAALNAIRKASPGFKIRGPVRLGHQILFLAGR